jgi:hypothetical protein
MVEAKIVNEDGNLQVPKNQFINESVELIHKGGGKYVIHLKGLHKRISSETEEKFVEVDDLEINSENKEALERVFNKIVGR